jgi:hypothetical protein
MLRAVTSSHHKDDDAAFAARVARFEAAASALRALLSALAAQAAAAAAARAATTDLAAALRAFDGERAARPGGGDPFRAVAAAVAGADVAASAMGSRFRSEVRVEVEALVEALKGVREAVKRRGVEAGGVVRWERKVAAARAGGPGKAGRRLAEYERRLREMRGRAAMAHAEAVNRMDNIDRNLPGMLGAPLVSFVELSADGHGAMERAYAAAAARHVPGCRLALQAALPAPPPPGELDVSPISSAGQPRAARSVDSGRAGGTVEVWDVAEFDGFGATFDPASDAAAAAAAAAVPPLLPRTESTSSGGSEYVPVCAGRERRPRAMARLDVDESSERAAARLDGGGSPDRAVLVRLRALHSFRAQESNELSFSKGDVLEVVATDESGWWLGAVAGGGGGRDGYFPAVYCEEMTQDDELKFITTRRRPAAAAARGMQQRSVSDRAAGAAGRADDDAVRRTSTISVPSPSPAPCDSPTRVV